jgi:PAS domain S-box-containing protein
MLNKGPEPTSCIYANSEMADLIRAYPWKSTLLGENCDWPSALISSVNLILDSGFPMFIWWGEERIQFYNDAYKEILGSGALSQHPAALGAKGPESWPELWPTIQQLLDRVLETEKPVYLEDQLLPIYRNGKVEDVFWTFSYNLLRDTHGLPAGILAVCSETTGKVKFKQEVTAGLYAQQELNLEIASVNEELRASNEELIQSQEALKDLNAELEHRVAQRTNELQNAQLAAEAQKQRLATVISQVPAGLAILSGPDMVLELANSYVLNLWGRGENVIGQPLLSFMPEIEAQIFPRLLNHVFTTGKPHFTYDAPVEIRIAGEMQIVYMDFSYTPLKDSRGQTTSILILAEDVTIRALARQREQQLGEELAASNEELMNTNEQLLAAQDHLREVNATLAESEARLRYIMQEAPVAIGVLHGRELILESGNKLFLDIMGRTEAVFGRPLARSFPELAGQSFLEIMDEVFATGVPYTAHEARVLVQVDGLTKELFVNFVYQPVRNSLGATADIIVVAADVTEQVLARRKIEQTQESLRLATDAAELGTWSMSLKNREWITSERVKKIFGLDTDADLAYDDAILQVREDYRRLVKDALEASFHAGERFHVEYPIIERQQGQERWIRSVGRMIYDPNGENDYLTGALTDITEQKLEVQRKNDFIGMVSHELKTPLTSMNAYIQVLLAKLKAREDDFSVNLLDKANNQVRKMTTMINGFLNVSRLEAGKIHIDKQKFDVKALLLEIEEETMSTIVSHHIVFSPVESTYVWADRDKIGQVLNNLISNAVKYSPLGTTIQVSCREIVGSLQFSVQDRGIGIAEKDIKHLFDRYYRVESNTVKSIAGFGIGLYLCAEIVHRHNGNIWVESELGKGSTFSFTLPM